MMPRCHPYHGEILADLNLLSRCPANEVHHNIRLAYEGAVPGFDSFDLNIRARVPSRAHHQFLEGSRDSFVVFTEEIGVGGLLPECRVDRCGKSCERV